MILKGYDFGLGEAREILALDLTYLCLFLV